MGVLLTCGSDDDCCRRDGRNVEFRSPVAMWGRSAVGGRLPSLRTLKKKEKERMRLEVILRGVPTLLREDAMMISWFSYGGAWAASLGGRLLLLRDLKKKDKS